jgi:hypothetical protein
MILGKRENVGKCKVKEQTLDRTLWRLRSGVTDMNNIDLAMEGNLDLRKADYGVTDMNNKDIHMNNIVFCHEQC